MSNDFIRPNVKRAKYPPALIAEMLFAQRILAGKEAKVEDADKMLKSLGLTAIPATFIIANAKRLADTNHERVERYLRDNAPGVVGVLVASGMEDLFMDSLSSIIGDDNASADWRLLRQTARNGRTKQSGLRKWFEEGLEQLAQIALGILALAVLCLIAFAGETFGLMSVLLVFLGALALIGLIVFRRTVMRGICSSTVKAIRAIRLGLRRIEEVTRP